MSTRTRLTARAIVLVGALVGVSGVFLSWRAPPHPEVVVRRTARKPPAEPPEFAEAPPEVRAFLGRALEKLADADIEDQGFRLFQWPRPDKPTREAVGVKAVAGIDPDAFIERVMDVDGYKGRIAHVEECRSLPEAERGPPRRVRFLQVVDVPGIARIQQVLVLVDAGTIQGRRVAYWYLIKDATDALDRGRAARGGFNVGAWFAAPGTVGYSLSCWPRRDDVNALQWAALTKGADALAKGMVERNIDGMAAWARPHGQNPGGP